MRRRGPWLLVVLLANAFTVVGCLIWSGSMARSVRDRMDSDKEERMKWREWVAREFEANRLRDEALLSVLDRSVTVIERFGETLGAMRKEGR